MRHIIQQDNRVDNAINRLSATLDNHYDPHLLPKKSCIYATTANPGMKAILKKLGFSEIGNSYQGSHNTDAIQILVLRNE